MGLDVGDKRVGVAVSDELGVMATPRAPLMRIRLAEDLRRVAARAALEGAAAIVVGMPRNMDGSFGEQAEKVRRFGEALGQATAVPVYFWDERLSTREALSRLVERSVSRSQRRRQVDGEAARIILQGYLDHERRHDRPVSDAEGQPNGGIP